MPIQPIPVRLKNDPVAEEAINRNIREIVDEVNRGWKPRRTTVADAAYTVLATDQYIGITSITASRTMTLPLANQAGDGKILVFTDESGSVSATVTVILDGNGSETINGSTTYVMNAARESTVIRCNGTSWFVIASFGE